MSKNEHKKRFRIASGRCTVILHSKQTNDIAKVTSSGLLLCQILFSAAPLQIFCHFSQFGY